MISYWLSENNRDVCSVGKTTNEDGYEGDKKSLGGGGAVWSVSKEQTAESIRSVHYSHAHSKKVIKHALRQQAKRRRKNTTIAAGNSAPVPHYVTPSLEGMPREYFLYGLFKPWKCNQCTRLQLTKKNQTIVSECRPWWKFYLLFLDSVLNTVKELIKNYQLLLNWNKPKKDVSI